MDFLMTDKAKQDRRDCNFYRCAEEFLDKLMTDTDVGGKHYSPDLHDYLADNREWLTDEIAALIDYVADRPCG